MLITIIKITRVDRTHSFVSGREVNTIFRTGNTRYLRQTVSLAVEKHKYALIAVIHDNIGTGNMRGFGLTGCQPAIFASLLISVQCLINGEHGISHNKNRKVMP